MAILLNSEDLDMYYYIILCRIVLQNNIYFFRKNILASFMLQGFHRMPIYLFCKTSDTGGVDIDKLTKMVNLISAISESGKK
jgi:hypothetical protein